MNQIRFKFNFNKIPYGKGKLCRRRDVIVQAASVSEWEKGNTKESLQFRRHLAVFLVHVSVALPRRKTYRPDLDYSIGRKVKFTSQTLLIW